MFSQPHFLDAKRPPRAQQQGGSTSVIQAHQKHAQTPVQPGKPAQQMGEGSFERTRDYQQNIKSYLTKADEKSDAEATRPATAEEAKVLKKVEDEAPSHTKAPGL